MTKISEAKLTKMITSHLKRSGVFFWKTSDRYTSGVSDIVGCFKGKFFAIEIKATGKKARNLQIYFIEQVKLNGGATLITDNFPLFLQFMDALDEI